MADAPDLRSLARRAARRVVRALLGAGSGPRGRGTDPRQLHDGPLARLAGEAMDASVPKNASGNNASVR